MAASEREIGRCTCPVCKSDRARLRVSAKQLAYVVCNTCNAQVFGRSDRSDEALRALHIKEAPETPQQPEPAKQEPAQAAPVVQAQAVVKKSAMSWGILGG